jgi:hypothetical protein
MDRLPRSRGGYRPLGHEGEIRLPRRFPWSKTHLSCFATTPRSRDGECCNAAAFGFDPPLIVNTMAFPHLNPFV